MTRTTNAPPVALINHVALVLDASYSMRGLSEQVVKVGDDLVKELAEKSKATDQETRISLYVFNDIEIKCVAYDKDVLRMPSLKGFYKADGNTPLIDAAIKALDDLSKSATLYGDHAFLIYVLTDGQENRSRNDKEVLARRLSALGDNYTVATFVPSRRDAAYAAGVGFPPHNTFVWETTAEGMKDVGDVIKSSVGAYYDMRSSGVRSSKNLFTMGVSNLTKTDVSRAGLTALHFGQYRLLDVKEDTPIAPFVEANLKRPYRLGEAYYQLIKRETVQSQKQIAILDKKKGELFTGAAARQLLGLPNEAVKVGPEQNPAFDIFIQSTSTNRKLLSGQKVVVLS